MNNFLIVPDSFKGTLSATEVCEAIETGIRAALPDAVIRKIPVADGGEGTVDALLSSVGGRKIQLSVCGPRGRQIKSFYGILDNGKAVIEMAAAAGLPLLSESERDPRLTTTYGVGELMADAITRGCKEILLGLGGSCTNDFGCGAAAALGAKFYREDGESFIPTGGNLSEIAFYDLTELKRQLSGVKIKVICDIDNPTYGETGAAYVFAPQKGADADMVRLLDDNLKALGKRIHSQQQIDVQGIRGGGAAGAMGAGMAVFFGAALVSGIDAVLDAVNFEALAADCELIFTGEGKFDRQSLSGKVCIGVARRAKKMQIPVIVLCGGIGADIRAAYDLGVNAVFSINRLPQTLEESAPHSRENLAAAAENIIRTLTLSCSNIRR